MFRFHEMAIISAYMLLRHQNAMNAIFLERNNLWAKTRKEIKEKINIKNIGKQQSKARP